jgi:hypothetical protein
MASTNNVITDETTKTVTIRQEAYTLEQGTFRKGYHHVIYATTVNVKKGFVNPGCDLTLYCARLVVDSAGGKIDVSGEAGKGFSEGDRVNANTYKGQSYDGGDGKDGDAGEPGKNGGKVEIHAAHILGGTLEVISRGGKGGRARDGGNGMKGRQPTERTKPAAPKQVEVGYDWVTDNRGVSRKVPRYGWGDDVKQIGKDSVGAFLFVTHRAEGGATGGNGGNAGLAGKPGNGGNGGSVTVRSLGDLSVTIKTDLGAGEKGAQAKHGGPGDGSGGGLGAKYLYRSGIRATTIDWTAFDESEDLRSYWDRSTKPWFDYFKLLDVDGNFIEGEGDSRKLKTRAGSGAGGRKGGYGSTGAANPPVVPSADNGRAGNYTPGKTDATGKTYRNVSYPYLLMLQRSATGALLNRDKDEAADILRWLMLLTTDYRNAGPSEPQEAKDRQRLNYEAEQSLLTLDRDESAENRAPRCVYTDIKSYSDFVETLLGHVARQEKNFKNYLTSEEKSAARKKALDDSIKEAETRVKHLDGNKLTPGSILYYMEKEKELKSAISDLDVQLLDYRYKLENMPKTLQEEIDGKIREKTQMSVWTVLELVGMAAGIAINFAGAVGSLKEMVGKVKDFYKTTMELSTIGEILKEGIWNKEFTQVKNDISKILETKEWEKLEKDVKKFIASVTDFRAKILAYDEIIKSRKNVKFDTLDVEASVLIFDTAKLELKKQRNEFEAFIRKFIDEYKQAQAWKHLFADYFDTAETRFDMLAHLADLQAERRELEYQRSVCQRNLALLAEELNKLNFHPENVQGDDIRTSLETNLNIAIDQALNLIMDEGRAFTIWSLETHEFPKVPKNLNSDVLRLQFHDPVWKRIKTALSSTKPPANRDFSDSPFIWKREDYKQQFELLDKKGRITLSLPVDKFSKKYFERLIDAKIYLRGAKAKAGSPFYCILRHRGISDFLNGEHKVTTCYQEPRTIEFSYVVEGEGNEAKPNYDHRGAIKQPFDDDEKNLKRIRYSPYATWEVQIVSNYRQDERSSTVYNQDIALDSIEAIELRGRAFFSSLHAPPPKPST